MYALDFQSVPAVSLATQARPDMTPGQFNKIPHLGGALPRTPKVIMWTGVLYIDYFLSVKKIAPVDDQHASRDVQTFPIPPQVDCDL